MSEQEFPVARGAAANNNPPALAQSPQDTQTQRSQAADPNGFDELESETTSEQGASEGSKTTTKRSRLSEFFRSGDVLRRIIILGLLVLFLAGAIFAMVSLQSSSVSPTYRELGRFTTQEIGPVLDFLDLEGYDYQLRGSDAVAVRVEDYSQIRELMLRRGIAVPELATDEGDSIIMSDSGFGVSQRLEGERIKHGREIQLARAIERIDGVDHATVLLAIPKENVFARTEKRP